MENDFELFVKTYFPDIKLYGFQVDLAKKMIENDRPLIMVHRRGGMRTINEILTMYYQYLEHHFKSKTYIFTKEVKRWGVEAGDYYSPTRHVVVGGTEQLLANGVIKEEVIEE